MVDKSKFCRWKFWFSQRCFLKMFWQQLWSLFIRTRNLSISYSVLPLLLLLYHVKEKFESSIHFHVVAFSQRPPFAFLSDHLFLAFQKPQLQHLLLVKEASLRYRYVFLQLWHRGKLLSRFSRCFASHHSDLEVAGIWQQSPICYPSSSSSNARSGLLTERRIHSERVYNSCWPELNEIYDLQL